MKKYNIFPIPQKIEYHEGTCPIDTAVTYLIQESLGIEEYQITITKDNITIVSSSEVGAYRANTTFNQLRRQCKDVLPCVSIHDYPDYPVRGLHYFTGGRIPTMEEFKHLIDMLADLKINQLQILADIGAYAYECYPGLGHNSGTMSIEEMQELSAYCEERHIDIVPYMQVFGHCPYWLQAPELRKLAECPEKEWPDTINPNHPDTIKHVRKVYDELCSVFKGRYFNTGCDEAVEFGEGANKELCEQIGKERAIVNYINRLNDELKLRGKTMQYWGDMLLRAPEDVLDELPKDAIALQWGYERQDVWRGFCEKMKNHGIPYYCCPGTSSWMGMLGKSFNAVQNISRTAVAGLEHGAAGLLNTDWQDEGILYYSTSYFGIAYGAGMAWHVDKEDFNQTRQDYHPEYIPEPDAYQCAKLSPTVRESFRYLNRHIFQDETNSMAQVLYDGGQLSELASVPRGWNRTQLKFMLMLPLDDGDTKEFTEEDFQTVLCEIDNLRYRMNKTKPHCYDGDLIRDEFENALKMSEYAAHVGLWKCGVGHNEETVKMMKEMQCVILKENERLCLARCRTVRDHTQYFNKFN